MKNILLSKYEKIKGYSSNLFDNEEWAEFDAFCQGYNLAKAELKAEKIDKIDRHHPIKFGRWLLKYTKEGWVEGTLCWQYEGKFYNTDELYNEFCHRES